MYGVAAEWKDQKKFFRFRNGAVFHMAYLESDTDAQNYQGWSLTRVYVEELTQYADSGPIFKLFATLRTARAASVPVPRHLQPRRPRPPLGQALGHRPRPVSPLQRPRDRL